MLKKLGVTVSGDIGCYTLGALPPLGSVDSCICRVRRFRHWHGCGWPAGRNLPAGRWPSLAIPPLSIPESPALINTAYNGGNTTTIVLDNSITGMTGHQDNPTTGKTLQGDNTVSLNLANARSRLRV